MTLPRHFKDLLGDTTLARLTRHAGRLRRATELLHACLGAPADAHCVVANVRDDVMVIHTDSPAWAAKLRFQVGTLLRQFKQQEDFAALRTIHVKAFPANVAAAQPGDRSSPRSPAA